jgi:hypothetical protein
MVLLPILHAPENPAVCLVFQSSVMLCLQNKKIRQINKNFPLPIVKTESGRYNNEYKVLAGEEKRISPAVDDLAACPFNKSVQSLH